MGLLNRRLLANAVFASLAALSLLLTGCSSGSTPPDVAPIEGTWLLVSMEGNSRINCPGMALNSFGGVETCSDNQRITFVRTGAGADPGSYGGTYVYRDVSGGKDIYASNWSVRNYDQLQWVIQKPGETGGSRSILQKLRTTRGTLVLTYENSDRSEIRLEFVRVDG